MRRYLNAGTGMIAVALALLLGVSAQADTIIAPVDYNASSSFTGWDYGCQAELGCGTDANFGPVASSFLRDIAFETTGYLTATLTTPGASFSYGEIDDANSNPLDFYAADNGNSSSPVVFTFSNPSNTSPTAVSEFGTTIYTFFSPFTANVSAYDAQGNLLGSTSANGVLDPNDTCGFQFGCYSAFVGVEDLSSPVSDIASVVITTTQTDPSQDNWFGFGTVGVAGVPEPGTLGLLFPGLAYLMGRKFARIAACSRRVAGIKSVRPPDASPLQNAR